MTDEELDQAIKLAVRRYYHPIKPKPTCIDCGLTISRTNKRCRQCSKNPYEKQH